MKPLISVIIPAYNRAKIISEAVNSVLNQTYQNFEIVIIDDGSSDNTEEILKSFNDDRIRYIYQQNAGPSSARNNGIKNAHGDYIALLDSDDFWLEQKLEYQVEAINKTNAEIISCNSFYTTFNNEPLSKRECKAKDNKQYIYYLLLDPEKALSGTSTMLVKKECFETVGYFDTEMKSREDWDMWFRLTLKCQFYCVNEVLNYHRVHPESLSKITDMQETKECYLRFVQKVYECAQLPIEIVSIKNKVYSQLYYNLAWLALNKHNKKLIDISFARECLFDCIKYHPIRILQIKFLFLYLLTFLPKKYANTINKFKINVRNILNMRKKFL